MKHVPWSVMLDGRTMSKGVREARTDREVLDWVLMNPGFEPKADKWYNIKAGELSTGSHGDEFTLLAGASSLDESNLEGDGYLHKAPQGAMDVVDNDKVQETYEKALERFRNQKGKGEEVGLDGKPKDAYCTEEEAREWFLGIDRASQDIDISDISVVPNPTDPNAIILNGDHVDNDLSVDIEGEVIFQSPDAILDALRKAENDKQYGLKELAKKYLGDMVNKTPVDTGRFKQQWAGKWEDKCQHEWHASVGYNFNKVSYHCRRCGAHQYGKARQVLHDEIQLEEPPEGMILGIDYVYHEQRILSDIHYNLPGGPPIRGTFNLTKDDIKLPSEEE